MHDSDYHAPVMVDEVLDLLELRGEGLYMDGTVGGGGHAAALLARCSTCRLIAVDRDPEAIAEAGARLADVSDRVRFLQVRFDRALVDAAGAGFSRLTGFSWRLVSHWHVAAPGS